MTLLAGDAPADSGLPTKQADSLQATNPTSDGTVEVSGLFARQYVAKYD